MMPPTFRSFSGPHVSTLLPDALLPSFATRYPMLQHCGRRDYKRGQYDDRLAAKRERYDRVGRFHETGYRLFWRSLSISSLA